jgi:hypothetical protein
VIADSVLLTLPRRRAGREVLYFTGNELTIKRPPSQEQESMHHEVPAKANTSMLARELIPF